MRRGKISALMCAALIFSLGSAVAQVRQTRQEYVARYKNIAIDHMERYGIPASITMAQGILESDCGNSILAKNSNNHFGIKCKSNWKGRTVTHDDDEKGECFRAYDSVEDSYEDHAIFLDSSPRYDSLFIYSSADYRSWARGLKAAGYATLPTYAEKLIKIIEDEKLHLLDMDNGAELYANRDRKEVKLETKVESAPDNRGEVIDPNNFNVTINAHKGYNIERTNGLYFTRAKEGDSVAALSEIFDISERNLRRFNDLGKESKIKKGDIIYIERKKAKWEGDDKRTHQTHSGETLYSLSQKYGIRLKRLARLNGIKTNATINVSQIIIIK